MVVFAALGRILAGKRVDPSEPISTSDPAPRVLNDRYRLLHMIGDGGMAKVFAAHDATLKRPVAVKILREELQRDPSSVQRFLQEAEAGSAVTHVNIINILDFGEAPSGEVFLVMEYLEGEDLAALLRRHDRLLWPHAKHIAAQVANGLAAAHGEGVVHRDLSPANIFLVRKSDGVPHVKLLDFGIAKFQRDGPRANTFRGNVFGTARYLSPEQAAGKETDARSDVYALGVVLYEMLSGHAPFENGGFLELAARHVEERPVPLCDAAPDAPISEEVEELVMRALEKDPAKRFPDMVEFEAAMQSTAFDSTIAASNPLYEGVIGDTAVWDPDQGGPGIEATTVVGEEPVLEEETVVHAEQDGRPTTRPYEDAVAGWDTFIGLAPPPKKGKQAEAEAGSPRKEVPMLGSPAPLFLELDPDPEPGDEEPGSTVVQAEPGRKKAPAKTLVPADPRPKAGPSNTLINPDPAPKSGPSNTLINPDPAPRTGPSNTLIDPKKASATVINPKMAVVPPIMDSGDSLPTPAKASTTLVNQGMAESLEADLDAAVTAKTAKTEAAQQPKISSGTEPSAVDTQPGEFPAAEREEEAEKKKSGTGWVWLVAAATFLLVGGGVGAWIVLTQQEAADDPDVVADLKKETLANVEEKKKKTLEPKPEPEPEPEKQLEPEPEPEKPEKPEPEPEPEKPEPEPEKPEPETDDEEIVVIDGDDPEPETPEPEEPEPETPEPEKPEPEKPEPEKPEPEKDPKAPDTKPGEKKPEKKPSGIHNGFGYARKAIATCGKTHAAAAGEVVNITFDVTNGRAANVVVAAPHNGTPLGSCIANAVRKRTRYGKIKHVPGVRRKIKF